MRPGLPERCSSRARPRLIKAGSDIVFQLHYTANGKPGDGSDAKSGWCSARSSRSSACDSGGREREVRDSAGRPQLRSGFGVRLDQDVKLICDAAAHAPSRQRFRVPRRLPDGRKADCCSVPQYDFNWQLCVLAGEDIVLPKGTRIECTAHFDNSANNPYNPDRDEGSQLGRPELGRDDDRVLRCAFDAGMDVKKLFPKRRTRKSLPRIDSARCSKPPHSETRARQDEYRRNHPFAALVSSN